MYVNGRVGPHEEAKRSDTGINLHDTYSLFNEDSSVKIGTHTEKGQTIRKFKKLE